MWLDILALLIIPFAALVLISLREVVIVVTFFGSIAWALCHVIDWFIK